MLKKIIIYNNNKFKEYVKLLINLEKKIYYKINFIFCNNKYILYINKKFLNRKYYTDTITFNYNENLNNNKIYGDIYISVDQVYYNSKLWKVKFNIEIKRVIIHSLLHLIGYDDNNLINKNKMKKKEDFYIIKFKKLKIKYEKI